MADRKSVFLDKNNPPLPLLHVYPSRYLKKYQEIMDSKIKSMLDSIAVRNGVIFIQALVENDDFIIFEPGFRLSGEREYHITKLSGINTLELLIKYAVSGVMCEKVIKDLINPDFSDYGCIIDILVKPGKIGRLAGLEEVESLEGVVAVCPVYSEGDTIADHDAGTLKQVALRVHTVVKTNNEFEPLYNESMKLIKIDSDSGHNMLINASISDISQLQR